MADKVSKNTLLHTLKRNLCSIIQLSYTQFMLSTSKTHAVSLKPFYLRSVTNLCESRGVAGATLSVQKCFSWTESVWGVVGKLLDKQDLYYITRAVWEVKTPFTSIHQRFSPLLDSLLSEACKLLHKFKVTVCHAFLRKISKHISTVFFRVNQPSSIQQK